MNKNKKYEKYGYGVFVLKSKNSLFNADFTHEPRQLPDENGTFYATDKSLKYCIRRYVHDIKGDKYIFFWRRSKEDGSPMDIDENFNYLFQKNPKGLASKKKEKALLSCWDVRVFGATYAGEGKEEDSPGESISITGPIQITYGINKITENIKYQNQILSPFKHLGKEKAKQETIGSESKALEMHLAFDYIINPNTLPNRDLTEEDVKLFKEALCRGVSYVNSAAKIGSESEFMLYLESDKHVTLPLLKDHISIAIKENKTEIDLKEISEIVTKYGIKDVEIYYEPLNVEVKNKPSNAKEFNLYTLQEINRRR